MRGPIRPRGSKIIPNIYCRDILIVKSPRLFLKMIQCPAPFEIRFLHCNDIPSKWVSQSRYWFMPSHGHVPARGHWYCPLCSRAWGESTANVPCISDRPSCPKHGKCGVVIHGSRKKVRFACLSQLDLYEQPIEIDCQLDIQLDGWVVSRWLLPPADEPQGGIDEPQGFRPRRIAPVTDL